MCNIQTDGESGVAEETSVVHLDSARTKYLKEIETEEIGRKNMTTCYHPGIFYKLEIKNLKHQRDVDQPSMWQCCYRI